MIHERSAALFEWLIRRLVSGEVRKAPPARRGPSLRQFNTRSQCIEEHSGDWLGSWVRITAIAGKMQKIQGRGGQKRHFWFESPFSTWVVGRILHAQRWFDYLRHDLILV